jgi:lysophospholipase L1-like esterase
MTMRLVDQPSHLSSSRRSVRFVSVFFSFFVAALFLESGVRIFNLAPDCKFYPGPFIPHPIWDYQMRPGHRGVQGEVPVEINSQGFRGPELSTGPATRVLILGDSLAFGWGVPIEASFPRIIERRLNERGHRVNVINASVPGYSPWHYERMLKALGDSWKPDIVVVTIVGNDFMDRGWLANAQGTLTMPGTENLRNRFAEAVFNNPALSHHIAVYRLLKNAARDLIYRRQDSVGQTYQTDKGLWSGCFKHLSRMREWAKARKIPLLVLNLSEGPAVQALLAQNGYVAVSNETYAQHRLPKDAHPNRDGHAIIAEACLQLLRPILSTDLGAGQ